MRLRATTIFAALGLALLFAAPAVAAPALEVSAQRDVASVPRNDEYLSYAVKVKNSGDLPTAGPTSLTVALPAGFKMWKGSGAGWSCDQITLTCTSSSAVAPTAEFGALKLELWIVPEQAADSVSITFGASGGGSSGEAQATDAFTFAAAVPFGFTSFTAKAEDELGAEYAVAGGHPFSATTTFEPTKRRYPLGHNRQAEDLRDLFAELPAGFVGNPTAVASQCTVFEVREFLCPPTAAVGGAGLELGPNEGIPKSPIYKVIPEEGYAAAFAFAPHSISKLTVVIRAKLRSNGDYGVTAIAPLAPQTPQVLKADFVTVCGFGPKLSDEVGGPGKPPVPGKRATFEGCYEPGEEGASEIPLWTNPTRCEGPAPVTRARIDSWQHTADTNAEGFPDLSDPDWKSYEAVAPPNTGCAALSAAWVDPETAPDFDFRPDGATISTPAAYTAHLRIPQHGLLGRNPDGTLNPDALAAAHLKDTTVVLPQGLALNPAAAHGLGACSEAQAGYLGAGFGSPNPLRFSTVSAGCPTNSKLGNVVVKTPLLDKVLHGSIYLAAQKANPFGSDFALYLVIDDPETGIKATLAGKVSPDEAREGQITATFANNPQAPIEDLEVSFFGGPHASLANPDLCGPYTTNTALTPWSALDPENPSAAEIARSADTTTIGPGALPCPASKAARPFALGFAAGSTNPAAGKHSPFTLRLTRPDGNQEIAAVSVTTPPGFAATLKGVAICSEAGVARARSRTATGDGALELIDPSCPASSQIGTTTIGAGVGPDPFYVRAGKAYLTGPYKTAPLSLTFVVPAVAGPFDLGVQVVRTALNVNPRNAQITAVSDPIPQILRGVPLQVRDIRVDVDRPGFSLNPTNCEAMAITAQVSGGSGALANLQNRFQVGACEALGFKPKLALQLHGGTKRSDYQRLEATLTARPGDANIARAAVTLPHSAFLAQEHIRTVCTRVQFAADACPKGSIYGRAEAITPLIEGKFSGPVYLRSSNNKLPDLVAALRGPDAQPIEVELSGRTDSKNEGIRNTFDLVPDAAVTKFTLKLFGGKKSLIVNSRNLCKGPKQRATVRLAAQNGMRKNFRPVVGNDCEKGKSR